MCDAAFIEFGYSGVAFLLNANVKWVSIGHVSTTINKYVITKMKRNVFNVSISSTSYSAVLHR